MSEPCLGLDTALGACSAAIVADGHVLAEERTLMTTGQAEAIAPMVQRVVAAAGLSVDALGRIGVTTGPGTFTGQRIGLSFARGLALALGIPAIGVTTLEALASGARLRHPGRPVIAAIDARRGELYVQAFDAGGGPASEAALLKQDEAAALLVDHTTILAGTGAPILAGLTSATTIDADDQPSAALVAALAAQRRPGLHPPSPFYLRAPDAKLPGPLKPLPAARSQAP